MHFIYTSGYLKPDHTTLSCFRCEHLDLLYNYFLQIVAHAIERGLTDLSIVSIDGTKPPGYNAQIGVEGKNHLILSCDVVPDRNDKQQFQRQHQNIENNVGADHTRHYPTDSGYHALEQLEYIEEKHIDAYIPDPTPHLRSQKSKTKKADPEQIKQQTGKIQKSDFLYDPKEDVYICPKGEKLTFKRIKKEKKRQVTLYQKQNCHACTLAKLCLAPNNRSGTRNILRDDREIYAEIMKEKMNTQIAKELMFIRKTTVEPTFGNLKQILGFRRFHLRGLQKVKAEFTPAGVPLMCIAYNLNKLFRVHRVNLTSFMFNKILKICANFSQLIIYKKKYLLLRF